MAHGVLFGVRKLPHLLVALSTVALIGCEQLQQPTDQGSIARSQTTPVAVFGGRTWISFSTGYQHTCGVDDANTAWCWGANTYGQLGVATAANTCTEVFTCAFRPLEVSGGHDFIKVVASVTYTCGLRTDGKAMCWGGGFLTNGTGYLGNDSLTRRTAPTLVIADSLFTDIEIGIDNACALTASGTAWCWGENDWGELGDGTAIPRLKPVPVLGGATYTKLAMGWSHTCGILPDQTAQCWGLNTYGQVGVDTVYPAGTVGRELLPRAVTNSGAYTSIVGGADHTCALAVDGQIACWGRNDSFGQLGDGSGVLLRRTPATIGDNRTYTSVASGPFSVCGRANTGTAYCWGNNAYGGLGNGTRSVLPIAVPDDVLGGPFTDVRSGGFHSCALDGTQKMFCWGDIKYGALGK